MSEVEPSVKITLTATYEKLDRLEKQVASDFSEIKLALQEVSLGLRPYKDLEARVRRLEEWRWKQAGIAAIIGVLPASILTLIVTKLLG